MSSTAAEAGMDEVSPNLIVDAMFACRKTAAIKAAIELDIFTLIGDGGSAASLAAATNAAERGLRILCDYLVVEGFLTKTGDDYALTPSSRAFLDRHSPAYMGAAVEFLAAPEMNSQFLDDPISYVRNGGSVGLANISADNPVWVKFARGMGAFMAVSIAGVAAEVASWARPPKKVLDIAAGHGRFGIEIAKTVPSAESSRSIGVLFWNSPSIMRGNSAWRNVTGRLPAAPSRSIGAGITTSSFSRISCITSIWKPAPDCSGRSREALAPGARSSRWNSCRTRIASALPLRPLSHWPCWPRRQAAMPIHRRI